MLVLRKVGQNVEDMPRPLSRYIAIYSLEVRTIFSLCFKEAHSWFCADYFCISYGERFARVCVGTPVSEKCSHSSFCKWRTEACVFSVIPGVAVSMRENYD